MLSHVHRVSKEHLFNGFTSVGTKLQVASLLLKRRPYCHVWDAIFLLTLSKNVKLDSFPPIVNIFWASFTINLHVCKAKSRSLSHFKLLYMKLQKLFLTANKSVFHEKTMAELVSSVSLYTNHI